MFVEVHRRSTSTKKTVAQHEPYRVVFYEYNLESGSTLYSAVGTFLFSVYYFFLTSLPRPGASYPFSISDITFIIFE